MDKQRAMVALAVMLGACGSVDGPVDAGGDAQMPDASPVDMGSDDAGEDAAADAGSGQCVGMPDLSPCDDGRSFTVDACIDEVCVGRSCSNNQVARNCNSARLTLTSCEGVPFEDGTSCDDSDPFTTNTTCTDGVCGGGAPCPCPPGEPCCVGTTCAFSGTNAKCDEWIEIDCIGLPTCGRDYDARLMRVYCSGDSMACDGLAQVAESSVAMCAETTRCVDGSYVQPDDDEVGVSIGCVPGC